MDKAIWLTATVLAVLALQGPPACAQGDGRGEPASDAAEDAAFQCPEASTNDAQRLRALVDYYHWAEARHPDWSVADAVDYRKSLLVAHQCTDSLRDLTDYAKREWTPPPPRTKVTKRR